MTKEIPSAKSISGIQVNVFVFAFTLIPFLFFLNASAKDKLEITGQKKLSTPRNIAITLRLTDFTVSGPDTGKYPEGFTLEVFTGNNYAVTGTTILPAPGFIGTLAVKIRISGKDSESKKTDIDVAVVPPSNAVPVITGQTSLRTKINTAIEIELRHLTVVDSDDDYPTDFSLKLSEGDNYRLAGHTVTPGLDYTGILIVPVTVNDGKSSSKPFELKIGVYSEDVPGEPPGNAPFFSTFSNQPFRYAIGNEAMPIGQEISIDDADSDNLMYAQIQFSEGFISGKDLLIVDDAAGLNEVFDDSNGILVLFGTAPLAIYERAIKSVRYFFNNDTLPQTVQRKISYTLNDGEFSSETRTKIVSLQESIELDIPNVFSPNDDNANDLWEIRSKKYADNLSVILRIFDKRGVLIYESNELERYWDGKHNGVPVPSDTYFYTIYLISATRETHQKGVVTVLR